MKIEIWSDIACPFCYIGKAHLEKALAAFDDSAKVEVVYKSYQLDPTSRYQKGETIYTHLAQKKGMPEEKVKAMTTQITKMTEQAGVVMNFDTNKPANTFDAHRLLHLAAK